MCRFVWLIAMLLSVPQMAVSQDSLHTDSYFRVESENDVYQLRQRDITDRYYTNGLRLTLQSNYWQRWPTRRLLLGLPNRFDRNYDRLYQFEVGQEIYTPRSIVRPSPEYRASTAVYDRPYAGYLYVSWGLITSDAVGGRKLTTNLLLGVIGPLSVGSGAQKELHHIINEPQPVGWNRQLRDDPAISYSVRYEGRPIGRSGRDLDVIGLLEGNVGTLTNYAGTGLTVRFGRFNDYFQHATGLYDSRRSAAGQRPFQFYAFVRPIFRAVLDNSLLMGGILNRNHEPYALPARELEHFYTQLEYGGVIAYRGFQLSFTTVRRGREYISGEGQQWGRIATTWRW